MKLDVMFLCPTWENIHIKTVDCEVVKTKIPPDKVKTVPVVEVDL